MDPAYEFRAPHYYDFEREENNESDEMCDAFFDQETDLVEAKPPGLTALGVDIDMDDASEELEVDPEEECADQEDDETMQASPTPAVQNRVHFENVEPALRTASGQEIINLSHIEEVPKPKKSNIFSSLASFCKKKLTSNKENTNVGSTSKPSRGTKRSSTDTSNIPSDDGTSTKVRKLPTTPPKVTTKRTGPTIPITPKCMKRADSGSNMVKKTSEDLEMEQIEQGKKAALSLKRKSVESFKRLSGSTVFTPVHAEKSLTVPKPFDFQTDKVLTRHNSRGALPRVASGSALPLGMPNTGMILRSMHAPAPEAKPLQLTVPQPFSFETRINTSGLVAKPANKFVSLVSKVQGFSTATPPPFSYGSTGQTRIHCPGQTHGAQKPGVSDKDSKYDAPEYCSELRGTSCINGGRA